MVGAYPGFVPENWQVTPWTWNWQALEPWLQGIDSLPDLSGNPTRTFGQKVQLRRYGGDLAGVLAKLDYLDSLGVNALYFNPLNDAPSLHKYDARNWRHIDRNFGPQPDFDAAIMAQESPDQPDTWQFTTADSLFLKLINAVHQRKMRLIIDYSFNHTGTQFWAWQDLLENQAQSPYADWYWTQSFDDPHTDSNEFRYQGWLGVPSLPEIKDTPYVDHRKVVRPFQGQVQAQAVKDHIFAVARRWLDPNGDGDPSDGVDGFRLDVAAEMPLDFWQEFRVFVRGINPEAYLIGEVWWEEWPDKLLNPQPYLKGDIFDGVMNYRWFRTFRHYLIAAPDSLSTAAFIDSMQSFAQSASWAHQKAWMNMSASHDAPRLATSLFNRNAYKVGAHREVASYQIHRPDSLTRASQALFLHLQFSFPGAPQIYNGDEMGMWGEDDPANRKPLLWPEYDFALETGYPHHKGADQPSFDTTLFALYQDLIAWRKKEPLLTAGQMHFPTEFKRQKILVYDRLIGEDTLRCVLNPSAYPQAFDWSAYPVEKAYKLGGQRHQMPARSFAAFRLKGAAGTLE